jgi:glycosyltransferase involved in cell wall biosynthesis
VPRSKAVQLIHQAHVFVITSLKDLTSTVLLEALFQGVPVVCPDHCGFSHVVTEECGMKLPIININQFVEELRQRLVQLATDEPLRRRLAAGAMRRSRDFDWGNKVKQLNEIYDSIGRPYA